jgi:hypothetical protein
MYRDVAGMNYTSQDSTQFPRDVLPNLIKVNPNQNRLLTVISRFGQSKGPVVKHPYQYEWYTKGENPRTVTANAQVAVGATSTLTFAAGHTGRLTTSQSLYNVRTGESLRLSPTAADIGALTAANVVRSTGATPAQQIEVGDVFVIGASIRSEASYDPSPIGQKPANSYNYTSEVSLATGATMKMMTSEQYAGWSPEAEQKEIADMFRTQIEMEYLLSELEYTLDVGAIGTYPLTKSQGILRSLTTNVQVLAATPDWPTLVNIMWPYARYGKGGFNGSKIKHVFMGRTVSNYFDTLPSNHMVVNDLHKEQNDGEDSGISWGWHVRQIVVNGVRFMLHIMDWWDDFSGGALNLAQSAVVLDANHIGVRYREGGRVTLMPARGPHGRAPNNVNYETACWRADSGPQLDFEASAGWIIFPTV